MIIGGESEDVNVNVNVDVNASATVGELNGGERGRVRG